MPISLEAILLAANGLLIAVIGWVARRWVVRMEEKIDEVPEMIKGATSEMSTKVDSIEKDMTDIKAGLSGEIRSVSEKIRGFDIAEFVVLNQLVRGGGSVDGGLQHNIIILNAVKHWSRNWTFIAQITINELCDRLGVQKPVWPDLKKEIEEYLAQHRRA